MDKDRDKTGSEGDGDILIEEGGGENHDREVVYLSPTNFDSARMPRTVTASVFTNAKTTAHTLRVQISKSLKKCDQQVHILAELDQFITTEGEGNSDNEDEFSEVQSGFIVAFDKIKKWNNEHSDTCFQLQRMCNFMIEAEVTVGQWVQWKVLISRRLGASLY